MVNVAVDIMGGDNAPAEPVKGAIEAVTSQDGIKVFLCGNKDVISTLKTVWTLSMHPRS